MGVKYYDDWGEITQNGTPLPGNRRYNRWRPSPTPTPSPGERRNQGSGWPEFCTAVSIGVLIFAFGFIFGYTWPR